MAIANVSGGFEFFPEGGERPVGELRVWLDGPAVEVWREAVRESLAGEQEVLRYQGQQGSLAVYVKCRPEGSRWLLARPEAGTLVATLALAPNLLEEIAQFLLGEEPELDLRSRAEKRPWNNLHLVMRRG